MIVAIIFATAALLVAVVTAINARHQQTLMGFLNRRVLALEQELAKPGGPLAGKLLGSAGTRFTTAIGRPTVGSPTGTTGTKP